MMVFRTRGWVGDSAGSGYILVIIKLSDYHIIIKVELETSLGVDTKSLPREKWDTWDPTLISEVLILVILVMVMMVMMVALAYYVQGLFAAANIFSSLKLVYIFSVNPYLGPLQVANHHLRLVYQSYFSSTNYISHSYTNHISHTYTNHISHLYQISSTNHISHLYQSDLPGSDDP